jgi:hypothetical protein
MVFRLLIAMQVIEFLQTLSATRRQRLLDHFRAIEKFPGHYSDYVQNDQVGRRLDVSVFDGFAIVYWTDAADRHVKILSIERAD